MCFHFTEGLWFYEFNSFMTFNIDQSENSLDTVIPAEYKYTFAKEVWYFTLLCHISNVTAPEHLQLWDLNWENIRNWQLISPLLSFRGKTHTLNWMLNSQTVTVLFWGLTHVPSCAFKCQLFFHLMTIMDVSNYWTHLSTTIQIDSKIFPLQQSIVFSSHSWIFVSFATSASSWNNWSSLLIL